jgi:hypothetical protein
LWQDQHEVTMATFDVGAFIRAPSGPAIQELAGPANSGQLVTDGAKLAQRFICRLLMVQGTLPYLPLMGTQFINMVRINGLNTEQDVMTAFSGAMLQLRPQLQGEESTTDPANERFGSATLNNVTVSADNLILNITITSLAGFKSNASIPLNFLLQ